MDSIEANREMLRDLFPQVEEQTIDFVLAANGGDLEACVEHLLTAGSGEGEGEAQEPNQQSQENQPPAERSHLQRDCPQCRLTVRYLENQSSDVVCPACGTLVIPSAGAAVDAPELDDGTALRMSQVMGGGSDNVHENQAGENGAEKKSEGEEGLSFEALALLPSYEKHEENIVVGDGKYHNYGEGMVTVVLGQDKLFVLVSGGTKVLKTFGLDEMIRITYNPSAEEGEPSGILAFLLKSASSEMPDIIYMKGLDNEHLGTVIYQLNVRSPTLPVIASFSDLKELKCDVGLLGADVNPIVLFVYKFFSRPSPTTASNIARASTEDEQTWLSLVKAATDVVPAVGIIGVKLFPVLIDKLCIPSKETALEAFLFCKERSNKLLTDDKGGVVAKKGPGPIIFRKDPQAKRIAWLLYGLLVSKFTGPTLAYIVEKKPTLWDWMLEHTHTNSGKLGGAVDFIELFLDKTIMHLSSDHIVNSFMKVLDHLQYHVDNSISIKAQWMLQYKYAKYRLREPLTGHFEQKVELCIVTGSPTLLRLSNHHIQPVVLNDDIQFHALRTTHVCPPDTGVWYYELTLLTGMLCQVGFCTEDFDPKYEEGNGVGDDGVSWGADGFRGTIWHKGDGKTFKVMRNWKRWKLSDVIGCLWDSDKKQISFRLNGDPIDGTLIDIKEPKTGLYPAISVTKGQACKFNFGTEKFRYPPQDIENLKSMHNNFDDVVISPKENVTSDTIFNKDTLADSLSASGSLRMSANVCGICFTNPPTHMLLPCKHRDMCLTCAEKCHVCPWCRTEITDRVDTLTSEPTVTSILDELTSSTLAADPSILTAPTL